MAPSSSSNESLQESDPKSSSSSIMENQSMVQKRPKSRLPKSLSWVSTLSHSTALRQVALFATMSDEEDMNISKDEDSLRKAVIRGPDSLEAGSKGSAGTTSTFGEQSGGVFQYRYSAVPWNAGGIEPDVLVRVALEDEWQMVSCASLPFTIIFFVLFAFFFHLHYGVTEIFLTNASLREKLSIPAAKVGEAVDIYSWLEDYYFPYLWTTTKDTSEVSLNSQSLYQDVIAGVRLTTTRSIRHKCEDELFSSMDCFSELKDFQMPGNGVFGNPSPSSLPQIGGRRMKGGKHNLTEAEGDRTAIVREAAWHKAQKVQASADERCFRDPTDAGCLKGLPVWARPGLSEGFQTYHGSQQLSSALRPKSRSAEAHNWCDPTSSTCMSPTSSGAPLVAGVHLKKRRPLWPRQKSRPPLQAVQRRKGRRLAFNRPEIRPNTPRPRKGNLSEVIIPISWTLQEALAEVKRWRDNRVIEDTSLTFVAQALIMNKNLANDMLSQVTFEFAIHRGGNVFMQDKIVTVILTKVFSSGLQSFLALAWLICLLIPSTMLPIRAYSRWKQGRLCHHFKHFWNIVEWFIVLWGWMVLMLFASERSMIWSITSDIEGYRETRARTPPWLHQEMDTSSLRSFLSASDSLFGLTTVVLEVVALFHIILICRFFLAARGQPRLAVVLSTIRKASTDLVHLLIVFMIIFVAYAVSGHILFGRRLQEFATFEGAFARCFQIVMEREYTWREFTEEDLWTSTLWIWSFCLLVVLVLVNIFLAIIFDTYGDVRGSVGQSATLWQTAHVVITHIKHTFRCSSNGESWLPNRSIVQAVKAMQCHYVTPWMVKDAFPGISNGQINYIFNLAKTRLENMLLRGNKTSLPAVIASILLGIDRMHAGLEMMQNNSQRKVEAMEEAKAEVAASQQSDTDHVGQPPDNPPAWVKVQLLPHFEKQEKLMMQLYSQIQRLQNDMHLKGMPLPAQHTGKTQRSMHVLPGAADVCYSTPSAGMLPAALRAGLTAPGPPATSSASADSACSAS